MSILYDIRSGTLVKSKLHNNGLSLKEVINSNVATPSILSVSDYLLGGGGESAISYAMIELADDAADWVLDSANNAIKYTVAGTPDVGKYSYNTSGCRAYALKKYGVDHPFTKNSVYRFRAGLHECLYNATSESVAFSLPAPTQVGTEPQQKYIPIATVAAQVISNAEAGHAPSQEAVNNSVKT